MQGRDTRTTGQHARCLFLPAPLIRHDLDGDPVDCDALICFGIDSYQAGCKKTWLQPAEPAEYEFRFFSASFDGPEPDDAPGPLTQIEIVELQRWFAGHYSEAHEVAEQRGSEAA